ncbi:hypothetical protein PIB30_025617 [Stylosanthes scabra]|uniref:Uncharacterized protein n=1 Tax=Stylosanthes scabra TaxID=79078 RepID=A0ABU6TC80_9FABA|nr:hypothetical protein [Stylosanthes scabra]
MLSQPLSNQWRSIHTLFLCTNQEEREGAMLHEEDVERLEQEEMHECIEEVEEENEYQYAENVDQEVEDKDKEKKGIKIVHFASSEATPPKLPSELHFKIGQLKALCGVLDKKKIESMELEKSRFKAHNRLIHKLHNDRAKVEALSVRKYLEPWQFREKLGWANRVWDPGKSFMNHHFWEVTPCIGAFRSLNPLGPTKFKHKPP